MISHKHRCIFVHIPKCAGQTVENLFVTDVGLTWESRAPLLLRNRVAGEVAPKRLAHLLAPEYVSGHYVSQEQWDQYFTFAVVRDPSERLVSLFRYLGYANLMTFASFADRFVSQQLEDPDSELGWFLRPQVDFLLDESGQRMVQRLIPITELDRSLLELAEEGLFLNPVTEVPRVNTTVEGGSGNRPSQWSRSRLSHAVKNRDPRVHGSAGFADVWNAKATRALSKHYAQDIDLWSEFSGTDAQRPSGRT